jgi:hypothetical protein
LWWLCPFHDDKNPSLQVSLGKSWWQCRGCGKHGDAVNLVRHLHPELGFRAAVEVAIGGPVSKTASQRTTRPAEPSPPPTPPGPLGMTPVAALDLVVAAEALLWSPAGVRVRRYLRDRGLSEATIKAARLGCAPKVEARTADGRPYTARGVVIPWFDGDRLALVNVRQPEGTHPKYREVFRDHPTFYPGRHVIQPGKPLIITEGEFDCLLLTQELGERAAVVTLGSASARPDTGILGSMLAAPVWFLAHDNDAAGDRAAEGWPASARRVRPPSKDWTAAYLAGVNLARLWRERLAMESFLARLQRRGIRLDGAVVHPRITIGTVTGRACYVEPALQTFPEADRLSRLTPATEGRAFIRADYGQVEPRILHTILHRCGLIEWDAGDDLYRTLDPHGDRDTVKTAVNKIINGGQPEPGASGRLAEFISAVEEYRTELAADARERGHVTTLAGRTIPLAPKEPNHAGKSLNRLIQGTAADIFNAAALDLDRALGSLGNVAFMLFDELWVECAPGDVLAVTSMMRAEMMTAGLALGVTVPVRLEPDPGRAPRFTWHQLRRWRWGPSLEDPTPGIVVPGDNLTDD